MENNLTEVFGKIVKTSRDTGLDIVTAYRNNTRMPKAPDEDQHALIDLVSGLDDAQFEQLKKGVKYCIELSLFKLINSIENGVGNNSFELSMQDEKNSIQLTGKDIQSELSLDYWDWIAE